MNRNDFMRQLESLLQNIASNEREEALQYYNDYFDDAGKENEQEVIEALGNPARVAESIRRDLLGSGYGDGPARKALASDRALMEYGEEGQNGTKESGKGAESVSAGCRQEEKDSFIGTGQESVGRWAEYSQGASAGSSQGAAGAFAGAGQGAAGASAGSSQGAASASASGRGDAGVQNAGYAQDGNGASAGFGWSEHTTEYNTMEGTPPYPQGQSVQNWEQNLYEKPKKGSGMPTWAVALLATLLVLCSPIFLGLAMSVLGVLAAVFFAWLGLMFAFGAVSLCMLAVLAVLVILGVMCAPVNPWVGMALIGSGLICGSLGILFLMLTVAVGSAVPAACKGLASLFRRKKAARG